MMYLSTDTTVVLAHYLEMRELSSILLIVVGFGRVYLHHDNNCKRTKLSLRVVFYYQHTYLAQCTMSLGGIPALDSTYLRVGGWSRANHHKTNYYNVCQIMSLRLLRWPGVT